MPRRRPDATEKVAIPCGDTTSFTLNGTAYEVSGGWVLVPADDPNLRRIERHFSTDSQAGSDPGQEPSPQGDTPGTTETPEPPADPQE